MRHSGGYISAKEGKREAEDYDDIEKDLKPIIKRL